VALGLREGAGERRCVGREEGGAERGRGKG